MGTVGRAVLTGALLALLASHAASAPAGPRPTSELRPLVLAEVSDEPSKKIRRFQPMADYLAVQLKAFGVTSGEVRVAPDLDVLVGWMRTGAADVVFLSPYPAMIASDRAGAVPILRRWKGGQPEYTSIMFARADGGLKTLSSLKGRIIAFDTKHSTSGYLLPMAALLKAGLTVVERPRPDAAVGQNQVGYIFTHDDANTIQWVVARRVAAGATDSETFSELPPDARAALAIIAESLPVPRHLALVRSGLDPKIVRAMKSVLLAIDRSAEGQEVLQRFERTARFDEIPIKAALDPLRAMYKMVQGR